MAEFTFKNKEGVTSDIEFQGNAITGDGNYLYSRLKPCFFIKLRELILSFLF